MAVNFFEQMAGVPIQGRVPPPAYAEAGPNPTYEWTALFCPLVTINDGTVDFIAFDPDLGSIPVLVYLADYPGIKESFARYIGVSLPVGMAAAALPRYEPSMPTRNVGGNASLFTTLLLEAGTLDPSGGQSEGGLLFASTRGPTGDDGVPTFGFPLLIALENQSLQNAMAADLDPSVHLFACGQNGVMNCRGNGELIEFDNTSVLPAVHSRSAVIINQLVYTQAMRDAGDTFTVGTVDYQIMGVCGVPIT